jgi:hypothetical protein
MYFKENNKRVFNIKFGESRVVDKLDVVAKVGRYAAYDEYIEFEYTLGKVFFKVMIFYLLIHRVFHVLMQL